MKPKERTMTDPEIPNTKFLDRAAWVLAGIILLLAGIEIGAQLNMVLQ